MAVSEYSDNELIALSNYSINDLSAMMSGSSVHRAMNKRREIQKALANYSRKHKYDSVQENIIGIIAKIEKWCRAKYVRDVKRKFILTNSLCASNTRYAKIRSESSWNDYIKENSF